MHWNTWRKKKSTRNWELKKVPCLQWKKSKRDTTQRIKLSHQECIGTLGEKEIQQVELGIDKVCQCILEWKKVKEIHWKE